MFNDVRTSGFARPNRADQNETTTQTGNAESSTNTRARACRPLPRLPESQSSTNLFTHHEPAPFQPAHPFQSRHFLYRMESGKVKRIKVPIPLPSIPLTLPQVELNARFCDRIKAKLNELKAQLESGTITHQENQDTCRDIMACIDEIVFGRREGENLNDEANKALQNLGIEVANYNLSDEQFREICNLLMQQRHLDTTVARYHYLIRQDDEMRAEIQLTYDRMMAQRQRARQDRGPSLTRDQALQKLEMIVNNRFSFNWERELRAIRLGDVVANTPNTEDRHAIFLELLGWASRTGGTRQSVILEELSAVIPDLPPQHQISSFRELTIRACAITPARSLSILKELTTTIPALAINNQHLAANEFIHQINAMRLLGPVRESLYLNLLAATNTYN